MPQYKVQRYWAMYDSVEVEADSVQQAIIKAHELSAHGTDAHYVPDSMNTDPEADVQVIKKGVKHG